MNHRFKYIFWVITFSFNILSSDKKKAKCLDLYSYENHEYPVLKLVEIMLRELSLDPVSQETSDSDLDLDSELSTSFSEQTIDTPRETLAADTFQDSVKNSTSSAKSYLGILRKIAKGHNIQEIQKYLEKKGLSSLNVPDSNGFTHVHSLIHSDNPCLRLIRFLIENDADLNIPNKDGFTPLHSAVNKRRPSLKLIKMLLENGADPSIRNKFGFTPLHSAINRKEPNIEIIKVLLENGADRNDKENPFNKSPLFAARNNPLLFRYLKSIGFEL